MRRTLNILMQLAGPLLALVLSFIIGGLFIIAIGQHPLEVYARFFSGTLGSWYGLGQVLFKTTPLILTGLAVALPFRAGLFNIGADGQLSVAALATAIVGASLPSLPGVLLIPACVGAGIIAGGLWGSIPGLLKARFGAHEVINTIMMNFVAAALVSYLVNEHFAVPATVHTPEVAPQAWLPRLDSFIQEFRGSPVNVSLFISLATCALIYWLLWYTRAGYEIRALGFNPDAATYGRVDVPGRMTLALALGGACAGLVGTNSVLGYKHYYELGFSEGIGFMGIAVALLGRNHPAGIVLAAFFFGLLDHGGLAINTMVPKELTSILQAIVILLMIVLTRALDRLAIRFSVPPTP